MFFSPELLERRDSGYGLLWLAATLGAKSSFKKLPKRSVLTADISQLCDLIVEPAEPLALRLSSNLMIGVARVYKVKQEMFLTDVTTCFNSLKKAVQDLHAAAAQLQMGQPSMRPDALTLVADPGTVFAMNFDDLFAEWDDATKGGEDADGSDADFNPNAKKTKPKRKAKDVPSSMDEHGRANLHTLDEHHGLLLSGSFDASFSGGFGGNGPSSSQFDGGFGFDVGFDDNLFALPEGMDVGGGIGDELARELGEGWGGSPAKQRNNTHLNHFDSAMHDGDFGMNLDAGGEFMLGNEDVDVMPIDGALDPVADIERGSLPPSGSVIVPLAPFSPRQSSDVNPETFGDQDAENARNKPVQRKAKRVRLLLDARTELTDDELKLARANYVEEQELLRRELNQKKFDKDSGRLIEEMIWGVPHGVHAPVLVDFWLENFRIQVEARSGSLHLEMHGEPPKKRRRVQDPVFENGALYDDEVRDTISGAGHAGMDVDQGFDFMMGGNFEDIPHDMNFEPESRLRSSEEPGQARRASRPPSVLGSNYEFGPRPNQDIISGSQRSSFFPWDHAGASSSVAGAAFDFGGEASDGLSLGRPGSRRGNSLGSRRGSPFYSGVAASPADFGLRNVPLNDDGFEFEVPGEESQQFDSQQSDLNLLTLERNSFNFLEYAKMQLQTFSSPTSQLAFDDVVPKSTSTPRVAAAAFYHCLVLATKNLVGVSQDGPYGTVKITVK